MLSEQFGMRLFCKQYNYFFLLHLIVVPQLSSGWQHYYSTKTRLAGQANEQSMYSLMSMLYAAIAVAKVLIARQGQTLSLIGPIHKL
jgi:hypothetical protein